MISATRRLVAVLFCAVALGGTGCGDDDVTGPATSRKPEVHRIRQGLNPSVEGLSIGIANVDPGEAIVAVYVEKGKEPRTFPVVPEDEINVAGYTIRVVAIGPATSDDEEWVELTVERES